MDGIQVTDTVFSRVLMLRTATLTCNRNLHEYLAFWSWFSYFWTTKALPTKPLVICQLFHCKCRLPGTVFKCEITLFKNIYFYIIQYSLDRWERVKLSGGLEHTLCTTDFNLRSFVEGLPQICNCSMLYSLHSVSSTSVAMDWFQITLYI